MSYLQTTLENVQKKFKDQPEFVQAVTEVFTSLAPVIERNEELYKREAILERLVEPDRQIMFRVPWIDDAGNIRVNTGYRVQFNNSIGPYKAVSDFTPPLTSALLSSSALSRCSRTLLQAFPSAEVRVEVTSIPRARVTARFSVSARAS